MSVNSIGREQHFRNLKNYIDKMPSLSTTVTKVMEVCNQPNTAPNDLNKVISLDPVLTGQVLKLINSAYYSLPNHVTSLTRAIIMLGINTVKNLALSTAVLGSFGEVDSFPALSMDQFWTHSITVGVTSKALALQSGVPVGSVEEYFVAGLLHDLGKIPLNNCFADEYAKVINLTAYDQDQLCIAESNIFGFNHAEVGKLIAEKWQLSANISEALCFHHNPAEASPANHKLIVIVALANIYANLYEFGTAGDLYPDGSIMNALLNFLGISWQDVLSLKDTVVSEVEKAKIFLKVSKETQ